MHHEFHFSPKHQLLRAPSTLAHGSDVLPVHDAHTFPTQVASTGSRRALSQILGDGAVTPAKLMELREHAERSLEWVSVANA